MSLLTRRRLFSLFGLGGLSLVGARYGLPRLWRVGEAREVPEHARGFVDDALAGLDPTRLIDGHVHLLGLGSGGRLWSNPAWADPWKPWQRFQYELYLGAAGIEEGPTADEDYFARLLELQRLGLPQGARLMLLAFDWRHREDGSVDRERSAFYAPDELVLEIAEQRPEAMIACASVHPYRVDALERLDAAAARGARAVKWLPSAMGIDPAHELCVPYYERMAELGLALLVHCGEEQSMEVHGDQDLGNPLRMRTALDLGVRVVMAHCASLGDAPDTDTGAADAPRVPCHELFLRLMDEERYDGLLFGDTSALNFANRSGEPLRAMLRRPDLHHRLCFASDYPLPALEPLHSTFLLQRKGYLTGEQRALCNDVIDANPLLGDLVVKRSLRLREDGAEHRFQDAVFQDDGLYG